MLLGCVGLLARVVVKGASGGGQPGADALVSAQRLMAGRIIQLLPPMHPCPLVRQMYKTFPDIYKPTDLSAASFPPYQARLSCCV